MAILKLNKMAKKNDQFAKEFKEISYTVNNKMFDSALESYDKFKLLFSTNLEIRYPFAPETDAFIKQLYSSLSTLNKA